MRLPRPLEAIEQRILGALLEKAQTTPDAYPLTLNALVVACNQKTGRQPVTKHSQTEILDGLEGLRPDVLVWRTEGARSERWNESITRRLQLSPEDRAVITLLLLRGPQTPGELRSRSDRLYSFSALEQVDEVLHSLAEGIEPLVFELPRLPGQKERRWVHLLGDPAEVEALKEGVKPSAPHGDEARSGGIEAQSWVPRVEILEEKVEELSKEVVRLRRLLGEEI